MSLLWSYVIFYLLSIEIKVNCNIIIVERVCELRINFSGFIVVGFSCELCYDGLVVCGWYVRLG